VKVPLMHLMHELRYAETDSYQVVQLSYRDSGYAMVVWLPRKMDGLAALEKQLTTDGTTPSLEKLDSKEVDLFLPRFKVKSQIALAEVLQSLGMKQAFTKSANFSGITDEPLWISAVIHEAVVEVDEKGTEAAAATAIVFPTAAAPAEEPPKPKLFRADHPFVYAIRHRETGDVLFWGRVEKPE
jgi:serpin B